MFIREVERTIREFSLLDKEDGIVVGVSGGPDSLTLLEVLYRLKDSYKWEIVVVHVNHGLRGREAEEDALYVERFCRERGIRSVTREFDVKGYVTAYGGNLQEAARQLRYRVFLDVAGEVGATKVALGHHADDRVETVLMRFLRGTGVKGLAGIPVKREWEGVTIVRPLWRSRRRDIEAFCREANLSPRRDSSNFSTDYVRNRVRLHLIPLLKQYNPQLITGILQLSEQLAAEEDVWDAWTEDALSRVVVKRSEGEWVLSVPALQSLSLALQRRVIQLILNYLSSGTWVHTENVRHLMQHELPSARCSLLGDWEAVRDYDRIRFRKKTSRQPGERYCVRLNVPGLTYIPTPGRTYFEAIVTEEPVDRSRWETPWAVFDAEKVDGALYARSRRPGDRIHIKGMQGKKRVKALFIDEKVSRDARDVWPCVADERDILWIPGLRRSAKALVTPDTRLRIYLKYYT